MLDLDLNNIYNRSGKKINPEYWETPQTIKQDLEEKGWGSYSPAIGISMEIKKINNTTIKIYDNDSREEKILTSDNEEELLNSVCEEINWFLYGFIDW